MNSYNAFNYTTINIFNTLLNKSMENIELKTNLWRDIECKLDYNYPHVASILEIQKNTILIHEQPGYPIQGGIGDCWLIAAMITLSKYPLLLKQIFKHTTLEDQIIGKYTLKLYELDDDVTVYKMPQQGVKEHSVTVDSYFPIGVNLDLQYCKLTNKHELWPILIEKGLAKLWNQLYSSDHEKYHKNAYRFGTKNRDGWAAIVTGFPGWAYSSLIGGSVSIFHLQHLNIDTIYNLFQGSNKYHIVGCAMSRTNLHKNELYINKSHSYAIIEVHIDKILLINPLHPNDEIINNNDDIHSKTNLNVFWLNYDQFYQYFKTICITGINK